MRNETMTIPETQQPPQVGGSELNVQLCAMTDEEKKAALRFCETCDDGEGYDVPRKMMKQLEALGLVVDKKFGRFEQTDLLLNIRDDLEAWALAHNAN
jgi:hypothetical protein